MKKKHLDCTMVVIGIMLLITGLVIIKVVEAPEGILRALPYVCIGLGCGIFGHGTGKIINQQAIKNNPKVAKKIEIEQNDERNIEIVNKAKAKAYDLMLTVFGALMVAFALMGVDLIIIILFILSYLFICGYGIYYRIKYDKEM